MSHPFPITCTVLTLYTHWKPHRSCTTHTATSLCTYLSSTVVTGLLPSTYITIPPEWLPRNLTDSTSCDCEYFYFHRERIKCTPVELMEVYYIIVMCYDVIIQRGQRCHYLCVYARLCHCTHSLTDTHNLLRMCTCACAIYIK